MMILGILLIILLSLFVIILYSAVLTGARCDKKCFMHYEICNKQCDKCMDKEQCNAHNMHETCHCGVDK